MTFGEHLEELRLRLIYATVGLAVLFAASLTVGKPALAILIEPAQRALAARGLPPTLQAIAVLESFGAYIRVCVLITVLVGGPWLVYQLWLFIKPGLHTEEQRFAYLLAPFSAVLTLGSMVFLYFMMLPVVLAFFIGFGSTIGEPRVRQAPPPPGAVFPTIPVLDADPIAPEPGQAWINRQLMQWRVALPRGEKETIVIRGAPLTAGAGIVQQYRISEYVKTIQSMGVALAVGFQTPIVVLLLGWAGLITRETLVAKRKYVVMIDVVASALLTPADPISMIVLAVPLYALFELGVLLLKVMPASRVARGGWTGRGGESEGPDAGDE